MDNLFIEEGMEEVRPEYKEVLDNLSSPVK